MTKPGRPGTWEWPNGAKIAIAVGLALEDFKQNSQARVEGQSGKASHFSLSYGHYGWKAGVWRLLDLLDEFAIRANLVTNAQAAGRAGKVAVAMTSSACGKNLAKWSGSRDSRAATRTWSVSL